MCGDIDYRVSTRTGETLVEFTWEGLDDGDPTCGRAAAVLDGDELVGTVFVHREGEFSFVARRFDPEREGGEQGTSLCRRPQLQSP